MKSGKHCRNVVLFSLEKGVQMIKKNRIILVIVMLISLLFPTNVFAVGDGNIDTGGGF